MTNDKCDIGWCDREKKYADGWCGMHHARARRGTPMDKPVQNQDGTQGCKFEGCEREHCSKGWCRLHYQRAKDGTRMDKPVEEKDGTQGCRVEGCENKHSAKGWCQLHYNRARIGAPMHMPVRVMDGTQGCEVEGCEREHKAHGFCQKHRLSTKRNRQKRRLIGDRGCARCGYDDHLAALVFHHRDPAEKSFNVSGGLCRRPMESLRAEVAKCEILCANCHRIEHASDLLNREGQSN